MWEPKKRERAVLPLRGVLDPDDGEHDTGRRARRTAKKSSRKPMTATWPMKGMWKFRWNRSPVGLDDGEDQDGEAPEGEEVGQRRARSTAAASSARPPRPARPWRWPTSRAVRPGRWPARVTTSQKNRRPAMANSTADRRAPTQSAARPILGTWSSTTAPRRSGLAVAEVLGVPAGGRAPLTLVLRPEPGRPVGMVGGSGHPEEADLADLHARVQGDRQVGHVGELQGEVTVPSGVDETGRRVDEEPEPARARTCPRGGRRGRRGG